MIKTIFIALLALLIQTLVKAQDDYMGKIMEQACQNIRSMPDTLWGNAYNMKLGLVMIEAAMPYKEELKRDYNIDLDRVDVEGEALGRMIGLKMMTYCPDLLMKITEHANAQKQEEDESETITGTITKIDSEGFVVFRIKDDAGKERKYYWLSFVDTKFDMVNDYNLLLGMKVNIGYLEQDLYDPRLEEYRQFLILSSLEIVTE